MRLSPLPAEEWDENVQRSLSVMLPAERCNPRDAGNLLATLVRHPKLARAFLRFSGYLLFGSTLPTRIREQAILRVAHRRGCAYEWTHHVKIAQGSRIVRRRYRRRPNRPGERRVRPRRAQRRRRARREVQRVRSDMGRSLRTA